jgi:hypothetical protein
MEEDRGETILHSFVVRLWLEEPGDRVRPAVWRGHVTHLPGGEQAYLSGLETLTAFVASFLRRVGSHFVFR